MRAARIADPLVRHDFLSGRVALRGFAAEILGVHPEDLSANYSCPDCGTGPELDHGRPGYRLDGRAACLILSLSRSRGWALLAARGVGADGALAASVGVDLEHSARVRFPGFDAVALTPSERQLLSALAPDRATLWRASAWARKEALLKSRGTGLRVDPATVEAFVEPGNGGLLVDLDAVALGLPAGFVGALAAVDAD
ncbi:MULTISPECIES: 4'-phosphopantetheinyl transferase family protein [unclassified Arthrobacter]|uniref:4'-phosphopantetheinyl transferase family protein n=1 Tax=unclassified Arthrobacter TaxID=235627 RepID=UPI002E05F0FA|nr:MULTISPECIES: 4'-phosphopantetheinyl transferase superfamily protein [unclassified Arthrobacter]MEC5190616.1 4'-phosphopantetheinyl transferase [Arthrobacter sp. MP_M4]MEC5201967.1 4'-phosphopantetheinyl transferase [Arthrobacter sp. MP_M7]